MENVQKNQKRTAAAQASFGIAARTAAAHAAIRIAARIAAEAVAAAEIAAALVHAQEQLEINEGDDIGNDFSLLSPKHRQQSPAPSVEIVQAEQRDTPFLGNDVGLHSPSPNQNQSPAPSFVSG